MKILEQTPTKLKLRQRPIWWLFAILFIVHVLYSCITGSGLSMTELSTLTCQRIELVSVSCELVASNIFGLEDRRTLLNQLQGAKVEKVKIENASSYQVVLLSSSSEIPFTSYPNIIGDYQAEAAIVLRINTYLNNPKETFLRVQEDHRWFNFIVWGLLAFLFFLLIGLPAVVTCTLDKTLNLLTIERRNFFSAKVHEHSLQEIADVQVEEHNGSEDTNYRISFVLTSGECIPLTKYYSSDWRNKQEWANYIRRFLNLGNSTARTSRGNAGAVKVNLGFFSCLLERILDTYKHYYSNEICPLCKQSRKKYTIVQTNLGKFWKVSNCSRCNGID